VPLDPFVRAAHERQRDPGRWTEINAELIEKFGYGVGVKSDGELVDVRVAPHERAAAARQLRARAAYLRRTGVPRPTRVDRTRRRVTRRLRRLTRGRSSDPGDPDHDHDHSSSSWHRTPVSHLARRGFLRARARDRQARIGGEPTRRLTAETKT